MNVWQRVSVGLALVLFAVLYFACPTKPETQQSLEKQRALVAESIDINLRIRQIKEQLPSVRLAEITTLEVGLPQQAEEEQIETLKQLSGAWFQLGHPEIAGFYAEELAGLSASEEAWSIAGTTYTLCLQRSEEARLRSFCSGRAVRAFENAISINPENIAHRINLALVFTEDPPADNPMKGILQLRSLNEQFPDDVRVITQLARLAIQTGQYERAMERLEQVLERAPNDVSAHCLMAEVLETTGGPAEKLEYHTTTCQRLLQQARSE